MLIFFLLARVFEDNMCSVEEVLVFIFLDECCDKIWLIYLLMSLDIRLLSRMRKLSANCFKNLKEFWLCKRLWRTPFLFFEWNTEKDWCDICTVQQNVFCSIDLHSRLNPAILFITVVSDQFYKFRIQLYNCSTALYFISGWLTKNVFCLLMIYLANQF